MNIYIYIYSYLFRQLSIAIEKMYLLLNFQWTNSSNAYNRLFLFWWTFCRYCLYRALIISYIRPTEISIALRRFYWWWLLPLWCKYTPKCVSLRQWNNRKILLFLRPKEFTSSPSICSGSSLQKKHVLEQDYTEKVQAP